MGKLSVLAFYQTLNLITASIIKPYKNALEKVILLMNETLFMSLIIILFFAHKKKQWNSFKVNIVEDSILFTATIVSLVLLRKLFF